MKVKGKQVFGAQGKAKGASRNKSCTVAMAYLHFTDPVSPKKIFACSCALPKADTTVTAIQSNLHRNHQLSQKMQKAPNLESQASASPVSTTNLRTSGDTGYLSGQPLLCTFVPPASYLKATITISELQIPC